MALTENTQNSSPHAAAARRAQSPAKSTILIAEDNADSREVMETLLRLKGFQVIVAENGVEAVELALSTSPDLILLDFELPGLNGLAVVRSLRAAPYFLKTPVVILSGHDPARYRETALNAGCDDYLMKPVDFDNLDQRLHEMIARTVPLRKAS
jgi:DNA-binding response OmpR family regulator